MQTAILTNFSDEKSSFAYISSVKKEYIKKLDIAVGQKAYFNGVDFGTAEINSKLSNLNTTYKIDFNISLTREYCLPKAQNFNNWIVFEHQFGANIVNNLNFDNYSPITIRSETQKIMGTYEPLICDVPFYSLRLSYIDHNVGWVIT